MNRLSLLLEMGRGLYCSAICALGECLVCMAMVPNACPWGIAYEPEIPEEMLMELVNRP